MANSTKQTKIYVGRSTTMLNLLFFAHTLYMNYVTNTILVVKVLANEDTLLRTHCCRHKCFPVCPRAQHLLRTQKMFLILLRNSLCPQQMFPSLRSTRNIMSNNVSATMCPRLPVPSSVRRKQLLCFVHGQVQKSE